MGEKFRKNLWGKLAFVVLAFVGARFDRDIDWGNAYTWLLLVAFLVAIFFGQIIFDWIKGAKKVSKVPKMFWLYFLIVAGLAYYVYQSSGPSLGFFWGLAMFAIAGYIGYFLKHK